MRKNLLKRAERPNYPRIVPNEQTATIKMSSPYKTASAAFNWLNTEYPALHSHSHWELLIIVEGYIRHTINGEERILTKGDACLIRPVDMHKLEFINQNTQHYQHINFLFDNDLAEKFINLHSDYQTIFNKSGILYFTIDEQELFNICEKMLLTQNLPKIQYEKNTKLIINLLLLKFFEQELLYNPSYPNWLNQLLNYINTPSNFGKSVDELAKLTPYSYSRLSRIFKQYMNTTLVDYINKEKMTYAKRLLRTTNLTTLAIANKIYYDSLSSFNHLFKNTYGITPSQYRKECEATI